MSFHLQYRPQTLDDFRGNDSEIEKLISVLDREEDKPHTFLFQGQRGCGKTTLARIAAKDVGCHEEDIIEMDIATKGGIDAARELKSNLMYKPLFGKNKAYILDEVHMGTTAFFNGLLKSLEEPPDHVYFFLCTTDPQKLLKTVKSRCMVFAVEPLRRKELVELLEYVVTEQDGDLSNENLQMIAEVSEGIPREALIMLDSVIDLEADQLEEAIKTAKTQEKQTIDLCRALLDRKSWKVVSNILKNLKEEEESIRYAILGYMNAVLLKSDTPQAAIVMEEFKNSFYSSKKAGLTLACYNSLEG